MAELSAVTVPPEDVRPLPVSEPELEFLERKRRRGEPDDITEYLWWASQKKMKKCGCLYATVYSDVVPMNEKYPVAWCTLRSLQCRELVELLVPHVHKRLIPEDDKATVITHVLSEIDGVIEFVKGRPKGCTKMPLGTAALWVLLLVQQHIALLNEGDWRVFEENDVKRASLEGLHALLEDRMNVPPRKGEKERHVLTIRPIELSEHTEHEATLFLFLLNKNNRVKIANPLRKERLDEPWLHNSIVKLKAPEFVPDMILQFQEMARAEGLLDRN